MVVWCEDFIVDHLKPNAPWVARLLFWGDVDIYSGSKPTLVSIYSECIEVLDFYSLTEEFNRVIEQADQTLPNLTVKRGSLTLIPRNWTQV